MILTGCNWNSGSTSAIHLGLNIAVEYSGTIRYVPGDHVGIFATNNKALVDGLVKRLSKSLPGKGPLQLQVLREQKGLLSVTSSLCLTSRLIFKN